MNGKRGGKTILIKEWIGKDFVNVTRAAEDRARWKGIGVKSSAVLQRPRNVMG